MPSPTKDELVTALRRVLRYAEARGLDLAGAGALARNTLDAHDRNRPQEKNGDGHIRRTLLDLDGRASARH